MEAPPKYRESSVTEGLADTSNSSKSLASCIFSWIIASVYREAVLPAIYTEVLEDGVENIVGMECYLSRHGLVTVDASTALRCLGL